MRLPSASAGRLAHDAGGGVDGLTVEGAVALDGRTVVQPDPDPDAAVGVVPPVPLQGLLDGDGAAEARRRGAEGGHEAVAEEGHLDAAVRADGPPDDRLVLVQDLVGDPVAMPGPELGRPLHVREQDRDRLPCGSCMGHPPWSLSQAGGSQLCGRCGGLPARRPRPFRSSRARRAPG
jgi:hypothetical protein